MHDFSLHKVDILHSNIFWFRYLNIIKKLFQIKLVLRWKRIVMVIIFERWIFYFFVSLKSEWTFETSFFFFNSWDVYYKLLRNNIGEFDALLKEQPNIANSLRDAAGWCYVWRNTNRVSLLSKREHDFSIVCVLGRNVLHYIVGNKGDDSLELLNILDATVTSSTNKTTTKTQLCIVRRGGTNTNRSFGCWKTEQIHRSKIIVVNVLMKLIIVMIKKNDWFNLSLIK